MEKDAIKIGYIGSLDSERKDLIRGIEVFRKIKEKNRYLSFGEVLIQIVRFLREIKKESEEDPRIRIMGPAPDERLVEIYDSFDAFFFPTKEEGFGLPIIEAQARGVPVIVFKDARIPKEVREYYIEINDGFTSSNYIEFFKEKYHDKLRNNASNFSWENTIKNLISTYKQIISCMVSICVYGTVFNNVNTVEDSIKSVWSPDYDIVIVDNYSKDGTWEKLQELKKEYNLKLLRLKSSRGKGRAYALEQCPENSITAYFDLDTYYNQNFHKIIKWTLDRQNDIVYMGLSLL